MTISRAKAGFTLVISLVFFLIAAIESLETQLSVAAAGFVRNCFKAALALFGVPIYLAFFISLAPCVRNESARRQPTGSTLVITLTLRSRGIARFFRAIRIPVQSRSRRQ